MFSFNEEKGITLRTCEADGFSIVDLKFFIDRIEIEEKMR